MLPASLSRLPLKNNGNPTISQSLKRVCNDMVRMKSRLDQVTFPKSIENHLLSMREAGGIEVA